MSRARLAVPRRDPAGLAVLGLYAVLALLFFGSGLVTGSGSRYAGTGRDPQIFIWAFAWWPHAILHGLNPFVTHAVWAPDGINLAWATMVPGLAVPFSPLTLAVGPVAAYNVAAVLMPALAAWTGYLLCRHLTRRLWPSLVGGYLFGFSSYVLGQQTGHLSMTSVFLVPLAALLVLQYVEGALSGRGLVLRLGPLLALQVLLSTELAFTLTLALAGSIVVGILVAPAHRRRLVASIPPIVVAYLVAGALTAPFIYYLLTGVHTEAFHAQQAYDTDLLNFVAPTKLALAGAGPAGRISRHFPGNLSERGAYIGLPALVIAALYAWGRRRTAEGRFLVLSLAISVLATLGFYLTVDGRRLVELPWAHIGYRPIFDNVLPARLSLYVALIVAVMVSLWAASHEGVLRWLLPALAIVAILPRLGGGNWDAPYAVPPFFTDAGYRACLERGENVLPLPANSNGDSDLWQVSSGFRFRMAGGYVSAGPPPGFLTPKAVSWIAQGGAVPVDQVQKLRTYIEEKGVTSVVVDKTQTRFWSAALNRIATPHLVGGVLFYRVAGPDGPCPSK